MTGIDLNAGAVAPVAAEFDHFDLPITGAIPNDLNGVLVRNGPNPLSGKFEGSGVLSWWPEAAMLHSVAFEHGRVRGYRNRWLRTQRWANTFDASRASAYADSNPNVNVIAHAGETLALAEGGAPLAVTPALDTLGPGLCNATFARGMTAHPKIDPHSGELFAFRAAWQTPYLRYGVIDANGAQRIVQDIEMSSPSMMHDMAITATHAILFDTNVAFDFTMLSRGHRMPLRWHGEREARLCVLPRNGGAVRWFAIAPCFIQHTVNAYDVDADTIVLDVIRYPWFLRLTANGAAFDDNPPGELWRYRIDLKGGEVQETPIGQRGIELPRINERFCARPYRYLYTVEQPTPFEMRGLVRYDWQTGATTRFTVPPGDQNSEPVFVPRANADAEDDGWLLACVYRQASDTSDVIVLDARDISRGPVATVHLPTRIPAGFHGAWLENAPSFMR